MTEWPTDGPLLIRIAVFLLGSGFVGWVFRRSPKRLGRWVSRRIYLERENLVDKARINSLEWEVKQEHGHNMRLVAELEEVHRRVEESRRRAERIDLLLGSEGLSEAINPVPPRTPSLKPEGSSQKPTKN
jgi:hypothetical protein